MKPSTLLVAMVATLLAATTGADVSVQNVTAKQRFPWNGMVDVECTVSGIDGVTNGLKLAVAAVDQTTGRARNGSHFQVERGGAWSDDREVTTNGTYRLLWDARADLGPAVFESVAVRVSFNAHEKVQLWEGGPYWATTNVGAENPEDYGLYFWWGDTVGYKREGNAWVASDGSWQGRSISDDPRSQQVCGRSNADLRSNGWVTAENVLAPEHDAAQVQWGDGWRMPTNHEFCELYDQCDWTWTMMNGVCGVEVRGRGNYASASIFLPAADSEDIEYWLSDLGDDEWDLSYGAWGFYLRQENVVEDTGLTGNYFFYDRDIGRLIRPVMGFTE